MKTGMVRVMKKNRIVRLFTAFVLFLSCMLASVTAVSAADAKGRVVIEGEIAGMQWSLYRVGEAESSGKIRPIPEFSEFNIPRSLGFKEEIQTLAYTFQTYITNKNIQPSASGKTDQFGKLVFSDLEEGWYTAIGNDVEIGQTVYSASPIMICVSSHGVYKDTWGLNVKICPKLSSRKKVPAKDIIIKFYPDDPDSDKDKKIYITIFRDKDHFDHVLLDDENDWTYILPDMPDDDTEWTIIQNDTPDDVYPLYHKETGKTDDDTPFDILIVWNRKDPDNSISDPSATETMPVTESVSETKFTSGSESVSSTTGAVSENESTAVTSVPETDYTATETNTNTNTNTNTDLSVSVTDTSSGKTTDTPISSDTDTTFVRIDETEEKLPQTGQLWWPVPVLASAGVLLAAAGFSVKRKDGK